MILRCALTLLLLFCQGILAAQETHVRLVVDLKKKFNFQSFAAGSAAAADAQGVVFISSDKLAVYQISKEMTKTPTGQETAYALRVQIFELPSGRAIKELKLPNDGKVARLDATHDGKFTVLSGDTLYLYSEVFEQAASRKLLLSGKPGREDWQVSVSPSGEEVVLAHEQSLWLSDQGEPPVKTDKTDIEVLDADTLRTTKSFTVRRLDQWSAGDHFIVTGDPELPPAKGRFGILEFDGNWTWLETRAQSDDPECMDRMVALGHELAASYDCDDLVVMSKDGNEVFSTQITDDAFASVAGADHYLAVASFGLQGSRHPNVTVYDLKKKLKVLGVTLERPSILYSVSPKGWLAAVDGDLLKVFEGEGAVPVEAAPATLGSEWMVDLKDMLAHEPWLKPGHWVGVPGIAFLGPDRLAFYHFTAPEKPASAEPSDSAKEGFHFQIEVFDTHDGHQIRSLRLPTSNEETRLFTTRDGKFIVRAGDAIYAYSAAFESGAIRRLTDTETDSALEWQIDVSPSGEQIIVVHQRPSRSDARSHPESKADVEVLDADTLQTKTKFSVPRLAHWSAGDGFLVAVNPQKASGEGKRGVLNFQGKWNSLNTSLEDCNPSVAPLAHGLLAAFGMACHKLAVMSAAGARIFSEPAAGSITMLVRSGEYVATSSYDLYGLLAQVSGKPGASAVMHAASRIAVFHVDKAPRSWAIPVETGGYMFAVSPRGDVAVVDGEFLRFFPPPAALKTGGRSQ